MLIILTSLSVLKVFQTYHLTSYSADCYQDFCTHQQKEKKKKRKETELLKNWNSEHYITHTRIMKKHIITLLQQTIPHKCSLWKKYILQKWVDAWIFVRSSMVAFPGFLIGILAPILLKKSAISFGKWSEKTYHLRETFLRRWKLKIAIHNQKFEIHKYDQTLPRSFRLIAMLCK